MGGSGLCRCDTPTAEPSELPCFPLAGREELSGDLLVAISLGEEEEEEEEAEGWLVRWRKGGV